MINTSRTGGAAGPKRKETPLDLASVIAKDVDGADALLGDLWQHRPAVLVFLRHYG